MIDDEDPGLAATMGSLPSGRNASSLAVEPPSLIADRYEVETLLGAGGMGRVYRARDRALDEVVALKLLRRELLDTPGMVERFRREVKLARRVTSIHVVRTFDLGQHGSDHFLTMEYVPGSSLARRLEIEPPTVEEAVTIARAVCQGMAAAHQAGVLHRDLKPDNVLVSTSGRIAITDFGIARTSHGVETTLDRFVGTPAYMAPEQVDGVSAIGPHTDVYALGAILFEMLTGRRPFVGRDPLQVAVARLRLPPPDPRSLRAIPDRLAELVVRCLAVEPTSRFVDASALGVALGAIHQMPVIAAPFQPIVQAKSSPAVAVLPLRAEPELGDIARGLTEEIVDGLSLTRALRVRPLASSRRADLDAEPRTLGRQLEVDAVVDGSLRRTDHGIRITARVIGVADGFQLWASRFEATTDRLLAAGDEIARSVARALTVELATPMRGPTVARATELFLTGKAKLREAWFRGTLDEARRDLESALELAPDDPHILATMSLALSRAAFYGDAPALPRSRDLADRAIAVAGGLGESWHARGLAALYAGASAVAADALVRAIKLAPGLAAAQATIGAMVLEAGAVDESLAHLEAAFSLDPMLPHGCDLARAYVYADRSDEAEALLERIQTGPYAAGLRARFKMWRGERLDLESPPEVRNDDFAVWSAIATRIHRTGAFTTADRETMSRLVHTSNPRLCFTRAQLMSEFLLFTGDPDAALDMIELAVDNGLEDHLWFERCPMLQPLRDLPRFRDRAAIVARRARSVLESALAAFGSSGHP